MICYKTIDSIPVREFQILNNQIHICNSRLNQFSWHFESRTTWMSTFHTRLGPSCTLPAMNRLQPKNSLVSSLSHESMLRVIAKHFLEQRKEDHGLQNLLLPLLNTTIIPTYPLRSRVYREGKKNVVLRSFQSLLLDPHDLPRFPQINGPDRLDRSPQ